MNVKTQQVMIEEILGAIDIPESAYKLAQNRYDDLEGWLRDNSKAKSANNNPHVYPQGSFRLGTVIKPWKKDAYDLDLTCKMQDGIKKETHTQKQLKELLGQDLEAYRVERHIEEKLEPKHRCWRLNYQDQMKFHIDIVPCIPSEEDARKILNERMIKAGMAELLIKKVLQYAVCITDDRKASYPTLSCDWDISNPEGYAQWFESRMKQAGRLLESRALAEKAARIEDLQTYKWRSPLQHCVKLLKRHRDIRYEKNQDSKPISIIITTLAARAYNGEDSVAGALNGILTRMESFVNKQKPRISNPVNPEEDFADKWPTAEGRRLKLEENFWTWLKWAKEDFDVLGASDDAKYLVEQAKGKFGTTLNVVELGGKVGASAGVSAAGEGLASQTPKKPVDLRGGGRLG